jgi:hypothetical protein
LKHRSQAGCPADDFSGTKKPDCPVVGNPAVLFFSRGTRGFPSSPYDEFGTAAKLCVDTVSILYYLIAKFVPLCVLKF